MTSESRLFLQLNFRFQAVGPAQRSRSNPSRLYATVAKSQYVSDGFQDLSFAEVARCVDNCASRLDDAFGCSEDNETVAYLGLPDLRTAIVFLAAVQCGYKACYPKDEG
ncbi:MAG: hypothetical protein L6R35_003830 [Caloplaca aegaea]|nr:MAG: hypothetical protein L6R35_003830 [Caloplaca aegaea]